MYHTQVMNVIIHWQSNIDVPILAIEKSAFHLDLAK